MWFFNIWSLFRSTVIFFVTHISWGFTVRFVSLAHSACLKCLVETIRLFRCTDSLKLWWCYPPTCQWRLRKDIHPSKASVGCFSSPSAPLRQEVATGVLLYPTQHTEIDSGDRVLLGIADVCWQKSSQHSRWTGWMKQVTVSVRGGKSPFIAVWKPVGGQEGGCLHCLDRELCGFLWMREGWGSLVGRGARTALPLSGRRTSPQPNVRLVILDLYNNLLVTVLLLYYCTIITV